MTSTLAEHKARAETASDQYKQEDTMQEDNNKGVIREFTRIFKNQHNVDWRRPSL